MCNQGIERLQRSSSSSETLALPDYQNHGMDSPTDETPRVKFLCSFEGSIMPRPQDGKLRYVGGETRIVSLPRDINYEELMVRMRELFEAATVLKYQQPDEDLDALVSVVNDDDVTNMMEEYDKVGSGDGFTRLRMFLFSNPDQDSSSSHFGSGDRDSERRYVDALNSLNDVSEFRQQQSPESPVMGQVVEPLLHPINIEFGLQNQQNCEVPSPKFNYQRLTIPNLGSGAGQHQQSHTQRYTEMEAPWSPAYFSPRQHGHHDPRPMAEFPSSPSSTRYRTVFGEILDKCSDRLPEEYVRQPVNHRPQYDQQVPFVDNVAWLPPGAVSGDKVSIPANPGHPQNGFEGSSICEHCRMAFQRNHTSSEAVHYLDSRWKHGVLPHLEPPVVGNEFHQFANPCAECSHNRETYFLNPDANLEHGVHSKEKNEPPSFYTEAHNHERGWVLHHQLNHRVEEPTVHMSGAGRMNEHFRVDGTGVNFHLAHGNGSHQMPSNYISHDIIGHEMGNEVFRDQAVGAGPHIHIPALEDSGVRYGNFPAAYGNDNLYQVSHGHAPAPALWIKVSNPLRATASYEALNLLPQANGTINSGFLRGTQEGSPSFRAVLDNPNPWSVPSQKVFGFDGSVAPECLHGHAPNLNSETVGQDNEHPFAPDPVQAPHGMLNFPIPMESVQQVPSSSSVIDDKLLASTSSVYSTGTTNGIDATGAVRLEGKSMFGEGYEGKCIETVENPDISSGFHPDKSEVDKRSNEVGFESNGLKPTKESGDTMKPGEVNIDSSFEHEGLSVKRLSFLPELIASVKKAALEGAEEVKARIQGNDDGDVDAAPKEATFQDVESENTHADAEVDSDNDQPDISKIEPTEAEEEALARGLQTIPNDDLEEIRELGSGTYGAVYHGKWKGSDVAIKRIKASCFAGKPSERKRLIADFWKEALILSSLHHPNVVSFYGIVRDGPDGSLATVTEFMVNGSLKQFLQKKDRTIDRRKRLIIAMDAAFGMEYLHGKSIVHFDLKCENLLVNMRDPHRPVCKIGDLGLSKVKRETLVSGGVRGTLPWMAPELLNGESNMVTEKIDVYSFGIVMWELLTGEEPYADRHSSNIIGGIVSNTLRPQVPCWCDPEWKSLMENCWASNPEERPSFSEISQKLRKMSAAINLK